MQQVTYSPSVDVRPEWNMAEQIAFASFSKLHFSVGEPTDVAFCGRLQYYDKLFDRVTPKATRPLQRTQRVFRSVSTSDDPVIRCFTPPLPGLAGPAPVALGKCAREGWERYCSRYQFQIAQAGSRALHRDACLAMIRVRSTVSPVVVGSSVERELETLAD